MPKTKKVGPTRGFGPRYGATVRKRYVKVITELKTPHRCPQCAFVRVKRESVGVWICGKCGYTFAGGAYTPYTKLGAIAKRAAKGGLPAEEARRAATEAEAEVEAPEEATEETTE